MKQNAIQQTISIILYLVSLYVIRMLHFLRMYIFVQSYRKLRCNRGPDRVNVPIAVASHYWKTRFTERTSVDQ